MTEAGRLLADRYQLGDLIGRGGMAEVYLGTDTRLGRTVAVKLLRSSLAEDPNFRIRFRQEAQAAARMTHPTIVRVFDAGEDRTTDLDGHVTYTPFIVMEHVDGSMLKDVLKSGPIEPDEAARIIEGVLTALEYSHRAGVVHRDIKPGNIMITTAGKVKVMDFGIARAVSDSSATVAETSTILGTAQYFSPEQARGESVDARSDLYSAGVVLFEMLTGRAPFRGDSPVAVAYQHVSEVAPKPSSINPAVSPAFDAVVARSLSKDRFDRYQTATDFREAVETAAEGKVPAKPAPADQFTTTLFGAPPSATAASETAIRQLAVDDDTVVRTQNRPPVIWIWAGIAAMIVVLVAIIFWVLNLQPNTTDSLSIPVPDVAGATYEAAAQTIETAGLIPVQVDTESDTVAEGKVIETDPAAKTKVAKGETVRVMVSTGKTKIAVPSTANMSAADAAAALTAAGLTPGENTPAYSPTVANGIVIGSDPAAGTELRAGDVVNLQVSNGAVNMPDVRGQKLQDALTLLQSTDLQLNPSAQADSGCAIQAGNLVTQQSIGPGDVPQGSAVVLTYCGG